MWYHALEHNTLYALRFTLYALRFIGGFHARRTPGNRAVARPRRAGRDGHGRQNTRIGAAWRRRENGGVVRRQYGWLGQWGLHRGRGLRRLPAGAQDRP